MSPFLQEKIVFVGANICYGKSNEFMKKLLDIDINSSQTHRITDTYAELLVETAIENSAVEPLQKEEILYAELDGSFVFTRDEKWKEVKVGRTFRSTDCLNPNTKNAYLKRSFFTAHLGRSCDFLPKFEKGINEFGQLGERLVFITDGAIWIRNWIQENYPDAISILDFYHAMDYLSEFAGSFYTDETARKTWISIQKSKLLEGACLEVIKNIAALNAPLNITEKIVHYYESNADRMDYKTYQSIGCGIIGSGAIESAHRTLIQVRMKLSGQRWSIKGAKNMLKLRLAKENNQWCKVIKLFRKKAA